MDTTIASKVIKLYRKGGYFGLYGGDVMTSTLIIVCVGLVIIGIGSLIHLKSLRQNWHDNRYKPGVMPFAGLINPQKGETAMETSERNFNDYLVNIGNQTLTYSTSLQAYMLSGLAEMGNLLNEAMNALRDLINMVRTALMAAFKYIINRLLAIVSTATATMYKMTDILSKMGGVFIVILNALKGYILVSDNYLVGLYRMIIALLVLMGTTVLFMGFPFDIFMMALIIPIIVLMGIIIAALVEYKHLLEDYFTAQNLPSNLRSPPLIPK